MNELITALRKLELDTRVEGKMKLTEAGGTGVFYPSLQPKSPFQEDKLEGYQFKIVCQLKTSSIKPIITNIIVSLEALKKEWNNLNALLDCLDGLLETFDLKKDIELLEIAESVRVIRSMHMIDVFCKILIPSGLDERGLTFNISKSEADREISIDVGQLANAIEEELNLWRLSVFPKDLEYSKSLNAKNEINLKKLIAYQNEFIRLFDLLVLLRKELIDSLGKTASELHCHTRNVNITTLVSSSVGIAGAGLAIAGFILAPLTAGASLTLTGVGVAVGATSGAVGVGATIVDGILTNKCVDSIVPLATNDQYVCNILSQLILKLNILLQDSKLLSTFPETDGCFKEHFIKYNIGGAFAIAGSAAVKTGVQVAKTAAFRIGSVALGLVFDITTIVFKSIKLSKGGCSDLGYKLESDALLLALELDELRTQIEDWHKKKE